MFLSSNHQQGDEAPAAGTKRLYVGMLRELTESILGNDDRRRQEAIEWLAKDELREPQEIGYVAFGHVAETLGFRPSFLREIIEDGIDSERKAAEDPAPKPAPRVRWCSACKKPHTRTRFDGDSGVCRKAIADRSAAAEADQGAKSPGTSLLGILVGAAPAFA